MTGADKSPARNVDQNAQSTACENHGSIRFKSYEEDHCTADEFSRRDMRAVTANPGQVRQGKQAIHEWLLSLDSGRGQLLQYLDVLVDEFNADLSQIAAA